MLGWLSWVHVGLRWLTLPLPDTSTCRPIAILDKLPMHLGSRAVQGGAAEGSREAEALRLPFRQAEAVPKADAAFVQRLMGLSGTEER